MWMHPTTAFVSNRKTGRGCDDVEISHCRIRSSASGFKFGTASYGGFRNIYAHDLVVYDTFRSAVALESVDGGVLKNIRVENISATNTGNAIFLKLGHRNTDAAFGQLSDVTIRNVKVEVPAGLPTPAMNSPARRPESRTTYIHPLLPDCPDIRYPTWFWKTSRLFTPAAECRNARRFGWDALDQVPEQEGAYPEFSMFGELPAWGFYVRHAEGIEFRNLRITLKQADYRPAMVFDDVRGVHLTKVNIGPVSGKPVIVLNNVNGDVFQGVKFPRNISKEEQIRRLGEQFGTRNAALAIRDAVFGNWTPGYRRSTLRGDDRQRPARRCINLLAAKIAFIHLSTKDHFLEKNTVIGYGNCHRIIVSGPGDEGAKSGPESPRRGGRLGAHSAHGLVSVE